MGECDKGARRDKIRLSEDQKNRRTKIQTIHYYMDSQGQVKQVEGDSNFLLDQSQFTNDHTNSFQFSINLFCFSNSSPNPTVQSKSKLKAVYFGVLQSQEEEKEVEEGPLPKSTSRVCTTD